MSSPRTSPSIESARHNLMDADRTLWRYWTGSEIGSSGDVGWTDLGYDDDAWSVAAGGVGSPSVSDLSTDFRVRTPIASHAGPTRLRCTVHLADAADAVRLNATVVVGQTSTVFWNGHPVAKLPRGAADPPEPRIVDFVIDAEVLRPGPNVVAVELDPLPQGRESTFFEFASLHVGSAARPYAIWAISLQVAGDEGARTVTWQSNTDNSDLLEWRRESDGEGARPTHDVSVVPVVGPARAGTTHHAATFRLPEPGDYSFRVGSDTCGWSDRHSFTVQAPTDPFTFLFAGDPQLGGGSLRADAAQWRISLDTGLTAAPNAAFLVSAGDQGENAGLNEQVEEFLAAPLARSLPVAAAIGNHDCDEPDHRFFFAGPDATPYDSGDDCIAGGHFHFRWGQTLFVVLNSNDPDVIRTARYVDHAVEQHRDARWRIAVMHHAMFSVGEHVDDPDVVRLRTALADVFTQNGIHLVIAGHDHAYSRTHPMIGSYVGRTVAAPRSAASVVYVTANCASTARFYEPLRVHPAYIAMANQENRANITVVTVASDSLCARTIRSDDGSTVDTVVIRRSDSAQAN